MSEDDDASEDELDLDVSFEEVWSHLMLMPCPRADHSRLAMGHGHGTSD